MAKKLYAINFDTIKAYIAKNNKIFNEISHTEDQNDILWMFGKSYYEFAILKFFKNHAILKQKAYSKTLLHYFTSAEFISQTVEHLGLKQILKKENNPKEQSVKIYFYSFVYIFYEKCFDASIENKLFEQNFLHYSTTIHNPTDIKIDYEKFIKNILKPKVPKESFGECENGVFFKLILQSKELVSLEGKSIKTLRKKAYKELFRTLGDIKNDEISKNIYKR